MAMSVSALAGNKLIVNSHTNYASHASKHIRNIQNTNCEGFLTQLNWSFSVQKKN